ncbi:RsmB/NOP family class I SAM-dependent RNA methyltransferase [Hazenella sp. IB182357]|uniref:RsmB/NOP family class I SAM-dependent RNA methyltransferase n=1 Tax=Polycladospora coralii TaxID=2771432 RepID=A0A926RTI9_9BACL|nr:RsmB/NOP family class I SAM-dependent RNA methyltransferase [Polycladospora coralii]MBD1372885.1 RsmB/NOP family class I SAM-dependent RNA methyltransferase [Polycladospora coralii]
MLKRNLPPAFLEQMQSMLQEEYHTFMGTYEEEPTRALRVNTLKTTPETLTASVPFKLDPIPWCEEAFYYQHHVDRPGKHVYHAAGLYYIQDASAMAPAEALEAQPGEHILDLCAAPGGKTTQIAAHMQGQGVLIANEIDSQRIKALVENLERCGVTHATVLNERPEHLTTRFHHYFDRILVDAPCSGEGMFRKDADACARWSTRTVDKCVDLQMEILTSVAPMLRPGGRLVYSTCTFNPYENEETVARFMAQFPEFELVPVPQLVHYQAGRPEWIRTPTTEDLTQTARLWPHHLRGEGHFVAVLQKKEGEKQTRKVKHKKTSIPKDALKHWHQFKQDVLNSFHTDEHLTLYGEHLYQISPDLPTLKGLRVERPGRHLGQVKRSHFIPSHALALSLTTEAVKQTQNFAADDPNLLLYLQGEALPTTLSKGWTLVTVDRFPLGWAKVSGGLLKNHYPKWLRWDRHVTS